MTECEFCGVIAKQDCCVENMWTRAGKEFKNGTMTQEKMDRLIYSSIEADGGFSCMKCEDNDDIIDTDRLPIKLDLYQCPKCEFTGGYTAVTKHLPEDHTDADGTYE